MVCEAWGAVPKGDDQAVSKVFVVISETMPVNGTYPASGNDSFWVDEYGAWTRLAAIAYADGMELEGGETVYYSTRDPEKFEYIEYRIEEHEVKV